MRAGDSRYTFPLIFSAIMLVAVMASGQEAQVVAKLDTNRLLIGDQVALHFTFTGPSGAQVLWPRLPDTIYNTLQIIDRSKPDTSVSGDNRTTTIHQRLLLTSFDTGLFSIPPVSFHYRILPDTTTQVTGTNMLLLEFSTLPVDTTQAIKPIKGPLKVPLTFRDILPWLLIGLGLLLAIALLSWYVKRRKKNAPLFNLIPTVVRKPHEIALERLEALHQKKSWQTGHVKEYHSELTDILRTYIEERFNVRALESTTDEIMEGLSAANGLRSENQEQLRKILVLADLVKFAKARPEGGENEESLTLGIRFVRETIPSAQPVVTEPENK